MNFLRVLCYTGTKLVKFTFCIFILIFTIFIVYNSTVNTYLHRQSLPFMAARHILMFEKLYSLGLYTPPSIKKCYLSSSPRPFNSSYYKIINKLDATTTTTTKETKQIINNQAQLDNYKYIYTIINGLYKKKIRSTLYGGSVLGARRHMGIIPFHEWDCDIAVFSTDTDTIEEVLNENNFQWHYNELGFGYHINNGTKLYIDLWLLTQFDNGDATCIGVAKKGGCELWYSKYSAGGKLGLGKPTIYNAWAQPDVLYPFGPYLLPIPYDSAGYLNLEYGIHWNISCSEYDALIPCSHYYKTIPFVFIENENKHLLRIGNEVKQIFEC